MWVYCAEQPELLLSDCLSPILLLEAGDGVRVGDVHHPWVPHWAYVGSQGNAASPTHPQQESHQSPHMLPTQGLAAGGHPGPIAPKCASPRVPRLHPH